MMTFTFNTITNTPRMPLAGFWFRRFADGLGLACVILMLTGCVSLPTPYHSIARGLLLSGQEKMELHDYAGALADFDGVVKGYDEEFRLGIDPFGEELMLLALGYSNRGVAKGKLGDYEGAIADFNEAMPRFGKRSLLTGTSADGRAFVFFNRGTAKLILGDYEGGLEDADAAKELDPSSQNIDVLLISANLHLGNYETVLSALDDTINQGLQAGAPVDLGPTLDLGPTYGVRSLVRVLAGDERGAITDADEHVRLSPETAQAYLSRSFVKLLSRDYAGAVLDGDETLRLASGRNKEYLGNITYSIRSLAKLFSGDHEGAATDFSEASLRKSAVVRVQAGIWFIPLASEPGLHERSYAGALLHIVGGGKKWVMGDMLKAQEDFKTAQDIAVKVGNQTIEKLAADGIAKLAAQPSVLPR